MTNYKILQKVKQIGGLTRDQERLVEVILESILRDAPKNNDKYARRNGQWVPADQWGGIQGSIQDQKDLQAELSKRPEIIALGLKADASVSNTTSLVDVAELSASIPASTDGCIYELRMTLVTSGHVNGDFKFTITKTGLGSSQLFFASDLDNPSAPTSTWATVFNIASSGLGARRIGVFQGFLRLPAKTPEGQMNFAFGQMVANATPTTLHAGSSLMLTKIP